MSRTKASKTLNVIDCDRVMRGISFSSWGTIKRGKLKGKPDLGESPFAYKDITEVMKNQSDLVEVVHELKPLVVVKG
jgi:tRNA-splicing ligase RtcB